MQSPKPKFISYCFYCKKQGHQLHEYRSRMKNVSIAPIFEGYCYNCLKCGHRAYEIISQTKPYWTNQRQNYAPNNVCSKCHKF